MVSNRKASTSCCARVGNDEGVKGVIVRIDSPGGEVFASDDIWREMNLLSKKKPMVISMSDTAASGGYYMAMTGDPMVAYPGTFTGSIGVVFGKANLHGLYDKLGVTKDLLARGRFADIDSDYQPLSPDGREKLRQRYRRGLPQFRDQGGRGAAAQVRRDRAAVPGPRLAGIAGQGQRADRRTGRPGPSHRDLVKEKARIPKAERIMLVTYPPKRSIFDILFGPPAEGAVESRLRGVLKRSQLWLWSRGGMMRLMPYSIEVR